jgi:hypothetical protein
MKKYIAYFDLLGYKGLIENNDNNLVKKRIGQVLDTCIRAKSRGNYYPNSATSDTSSSRIDFLMISDSIIFSTLDDSEESFVELLDVAFNMNMLNIKDMPLRGAIVFGDFEYYPGYEKENKCAINFMAPIWGKGLVAAYQKTINQNWAGCVIDNSVISNVKENSTTKKIKESAILYKVPYKMSCSEMDLEFVLRFQTGKNSETQEKLKRYVKDAFISDNKPIEKEDVQMKLRNTIRFIDSSMTYN